MNNPNMSNLRKFRNLGIDYNSLSQYLPYELAIAVSYLSGLNLTFHFVTSGYSLTFYLLMSGYNLTFEPTMSGYTLTI
ncbi:MAG: hypothetical protein KDE33_01285 [Bacteroidetes bacterium]|nr:hypothetical protein [Bacteroidota bacterium]